MCDNKTQKDVVESFEQALAKIVKVRTKLANGNNLIDDCPRGKPWQVSPRRNPFAMK